MAVASEAKIPSNAWAITIDRPKVTRIGDMSPKLDDMPFSSIAWTETRFNTWRCSA